MIGAGCKIEGNVSGRGNIMISGDIEGECDIEGTVTLTANGRWRGTIKANSVIVAGTVDGDICASGLVEIGDGLVVIDNHQGRPLHQYPDVR